MSNTITGTFVCIQPSQLPHCLKIAEALLVRELRLACIVKPDTRCYKNASFSGLHRGWGGGKNQTVASGIHRTTMWKFAANHKISIKGQLCVAPYSHPLK